MSDEREEGEPRPSPKQGVGKLGRSRLTWNQKIVGSNPTALTNFSSSSSRL